MSCYIVTDKHISAIIGYACRENIRLDGRAGEGCIYAPGMEQEASALLHAANVRSVNTRYNKDSPEDGIVFDTAAPKLSAIDVIKACDGLAYQCDEWTSFDGSNADKLLKVIQRHAVRKLPGYDAAPWSIE